MGELATVEKMVEIRAANMLEGLLQAAANPNCLPEKAQEIYAFAQKIMADQARQEWSQSFYDAKLELDGIRLRKNGKITYEGKNGKGGGTVKFLRYDDIAEAVKPVLSKHGLIAAYSYRFETNPPKTICVMRLMHRNGHFETFESMPLPMIDSSGGKNDVQGAGSVGSYGRRYVVCPTFDIVAEGEDDDGNLGKEQPKPITEVQARQLDDIVQECDNRQVGFMKRWFNWLEKEFKITTHGEVLTGQMFKAVNEKIDVKARELGVL